MINFVYDNAVLTRLTAEIWEHGDIRRKKSDDEQPDDQADCKQAKSLSRFLKPLYLVVKLKVSH